MIPTGTVPPPIPGSATLEQVDMRLKACFDLHRLALFQGDLDAVDRVLTRIDQLLDERHALQRSDP